MELRVDTEPIAGTITDATGGSSHFTGWLGLVHELERLRITGQVTPAATPATGDEAS